jgi:hypothetical protein
MPYFPAELITISVFTPEQQKAIGKLYVVSIAPPNNRLGHPADFAFMYPGDDVNVMGREIAKEFGIGLARIGDKIEFFLRNDDNTEDTRFEIPVGAINVSNKVPPRYFKIASDLLAQKLDGANQHLFYSSAPPVIVMAIRHRDDCKAIGRFASASGP